jgi:hypothetical protein
MLRELRPPRPQENRARSTFDELSRMLERGTIIFFHSSGRRSFRGERNAAVDCIRALQETGVVGPDCEEVLDTSVDELREPLPLDP